MRGYFCIGFIDFMFPNKTLIDLTTITHKIFETNSSFQVK